MTGEFLVDPDALDTDAAKWTTWSADLATISASIPQVGAQLDPLAFSILPNAQQVAQAYGRAATLLRQSADTGVEQLTGFATTLTFAATTYREAEVANLDAIAKSVSSLESL